MELLFKLKVDGMQQAAPALSIPIIPNEQAIVSAAFPLSP
jgi:hypothetical protein